MVAKRWRCSGTSRLARSSQRSPPPPSWPRSARRHSGLGRSGVIGGAAFGLLWSFFSRREAGRAVGSTVAKPGDTIGWGGEYHLRTFAVRSEMNVHILDTEKDLPELDGRTLTGFTWTVGVKVPV